MNVMQLDFKVLPVSERIQLVEDIWDSIVQDTFAPGQSSQQQSSKASSGAVTLDRALIAEIERRFTEHQIDPSSSIAWEDVRTQLFSTR
jgi:putative addiction module component (TIGR02574 family)